jgi:hypothetical protein
MNMAREKRQATGLAKKTREFIASVIGKDDEELLNNISGKILNAFPDLPGLAGEAEKKRREAGLRKGGVVKKTKGYQAGGKVKRTKGMSRGGVSRGMGAATKGGRYSRSS